MRTRFQLLALAATLLGTASAHAAERTSVDLYCATMVSTLIETSQHLAKTPIPEDKIRTVEKQASDFCRAMPAQNVRPLSGMSGAEKTVVSCVGFAEGASLAYQPKDAPDEPYSKLKRRREFSAQACASNPKQFQHDIFRKGPDYVLTQKY